MFSLMRSKRIAGTAAGLMALAVPLSMGVGPAAAAAPHPDVQVKQTSSDAIEDAAGLACNDGLGVLATNYYRVYDLSQYGGLANGVNITSVRVEQETAESADPIPGSVSVYAVDPGFDITSDALPTALSTADVDYATAGDGGTTVGAVNATIPSGKNLVIEASVDEYTTDQWFFMAGNHEPEVQDAYLQAADCGNPDPTAIDDVDPSLVGTSMLFYATGKASDCTTAETAVNAAEGSVATTKAAATAANAAVTAATTAKAAADSKVKKAKAKLKKAKKSHNASKIKKAKKKVKKAKAASKAAASALTSAQAAATAANAAAATAAAKLTAATAAANTMCAQPALPETEPQPVRPATGGKHVSLKPGTFLTR
jgi:hypothetical protein